MIKTYIVFLTFIEWSRVKWIIIIIIMNKEKMFFRKNISLIYHHGFTNICFFAKWY
jgi:hypothetical protein